jgi:type III pantothenate kinase
MTIKQSKVFSLDLGNSSCRIGLFDHGHLSKERFVSTTCFIENPNDLLDEIAENPSPLAYCSVSPLAEAALKEWADHSGLELFNLSNSSCGDFPITYPYPDEVGQDRIANSFAVHRTSELPAIVIDVGTATTFDIVGQEEGYMGGVIAPGPQGFLDFLHQNTALLPKVRLVDKMPSSPIGKKTSDAMLLGIHLGFEPMVNGILRRLDEEITRTHGKKPKVILAGGASFHLVLPNSEHRPFLTLEGIALAYLENTTPIDSNEF